MPRTKKNTRKSSTNLRWYHSHREEQKLKMKIYRDKIKDLVFKAYGGAICACCGEINKKFLSLDHINNDGAAHRKAIGYRGGIGYYLAVVRDNFPPGFQVLCYNCNMGKARNSGVCPHKEIEVMKANPLGHLEMELIQDNTNVKSFSSMGGYDDLIRDQVPVKDSLTGADTFKQDASKPSSRAEVEKNRMHVDSGADLKGASMYKEFGGGTGKSSTEFTSDKSK
jgi:hypothetical protein